MAANKRRPQDDPGGADDGHFVPVQHKKSHTLSQLDGNRAAQYLQHVIALNSQFTSWVQQQLKEHSDELWQDGLQDYLRHASKILADFRDVTGYLKPCTSTRQRSPEATSPQGVSAYSTDRSGGSGRKPLETSLFEKSSVSHSQPVSPLIATSFTTPVLSGSLTTIVPGQVQTTAKNLLAGTEYDGQEDGDTSNEPGSPSLKRSEEPGIKVVYEIKCKLYTKGDSSADKVWKDIGMGNLILKCKEGVRKGAKEAKATIVVRNDVGRVLLNALLYPNIKMNAQKNTVTGIFHSAETDIGMPAGKVQENGTSKARLYLFKLKTANEAESLVEAITVHTPKE